MLLLGGCYSTSLLQESRVLPPGRTRATVGVGYAHSAEGESGPTVELLGRLGITERLELQGKLSNRSSAGAYAKIGLIDRPSWRSSLLTGFQYAQVAQAVSGNEVLQARDVVGFNLTPMVGLHASDLVEFVLAPDLQVGARSSDRWENWLGVGGHVGIALHVAERATIIPECGALYVAVGPQAGAEALFDVTKDTVFTRGDVRMQCGVGVSFGSYYRQ